MAVVDLYCSRTFNTPAMEETVAEQAFPKAELLLKVFRSLLSSLKMILFFDKKYIF